MLTRHLLPAVALAALTLSTPALAASDGDYARNVIQTGWLHFFTLEEDEPLTTTVTPSPVTQATGIPTEFTSPGTGVSIEDGDTLFLAYTRYFTPNWALELAGGLPLDFDITGKGTIMPFAPQSTPYDLQLGAAENNPLASVKQWSPTLILQYHFGTPQSKLRPYAGLGFTYTWFTDFKLDEDFVDGINAPTGLGPALAAGFGETASSVSVDTDNAFGVAINGGFSYLINANWGVTGSLTWLLIETTASIDVHAADSGQLLARTQGDIKLNPLVAGLFLSYRF